MSLGDEMQVPMPRNPYSGQQSLLYQQGYNFVQNAGAQMLNRLMPGDTQRWASRPKPWRDGFADSAKAIGLERIGEQVRGSEKTAMWAAEYIKKAFGPETIGGVVGGVAQDVVAENEARNATEREAVRGTTLSNLPSQLLSNAIPIGTAALGAYAGAHIPQIGDVVHHAIPGLYHIGLSGIHEPARAIGSAMVGGAAGLPLTYYLNKHIARKRLEQHREDQ